MKKRMTMKRKTTGTDFAFVRRGTTGSICRLTFNVDRFVSKTGIVPYLCTPMVRPFNLIVSMTRDTNNHKVTVTYDHRCLLLLAKYDLSRS